MTNLKRLCCLLIAFCVSATFSSGLIANDPPLVDTIYLKNGGVLYGVAEEIVESKQKFLLITTTDGTVLKLKRSQVSQVRKPTEAMREYIERKNAIADTVDAHWEMQQWCVDNQRRDPRLQDQREYHLLRIIELDPDHKDARARLGHKDIDGVWVHWDHFMLNQGYVKDGRGVQRLPQAIEMNERKDANELVVKEWNKKLKNLLTKIRKRNDAAAKKEFQSIKDPTAVTGLMKLYKDAKLSDDALKKEIIDVLGQIESGVSQNALVKIATTDPSLDLAERAVNLLRQDHFNRDGIINSVVHWLRPSPNSSLNSNVLVNRAAWLIGRMEYNGAVRELIDALNTTHLVKIHGGANTASQGSQGTGLDWGKKKTHAPQSVQNDSVLATLRMVTPGGVDFAYDEDAWMDWYIRQNTMSTFQIGRDQ